MCREEKVRLQKTKDIDTKRRKGRHLSLLYLYRIASSKNLDSSSHHKYFALSRIVSDYKKGYMPVCIEFSTLC